MRLLNILVIMMISLLAFGCVTVNTLPIEIEDEDVKDESLSAAYWATSKIGIPSAGISANGHETVVVSNNEPFTVTILSMTFDGRDMLNGNNYVLATGERRAIDSGDVFNADDCAAGTKYSFPVVIEYTDDISSEEIILLEGTKNYVGTCAN